VLARLTVGVGPAHLARSDLVIEAVPEDPALKLQMLAALEAVVSPVAAMATNTSSLSIDELAAVLGHPERFCGLHFFNPVPASQLVEIVVGRATLPAAASGSHSASRRSACWKTVSPPLRTSTPP
jgi:3-hydroxybutyryl-CoA dehydrogenase